MYWKTCGERNLSKITKVGHGCESCEDDQALANPLEKIKFVDISYDPNNNSLDIFFKRKKLQWNNGVGIQLNNLSDDEKNSLEQYLENGK